MKTQTNPWTLVFIMTGLLTGQILFAQNVNIRQAGGLRHELAKANQDSSRAIILGEAYRTEKPDPALYFADETLQLSHRINFPFGEMRAYLVLCFYFRMTIAIGYLPPFVF